MAVLGLGVMGGSLVRALAAEAPGLPVTAWSPEPDERAAARHEAGAAEASDAVRAVDDADLVVLAAPVGATCALLARLAPHLAPDAVITDVASVKEPVARAAADAGLTDRWVGSHPMVGSEARGFAAGRADLYRGARVWIVPGPEGPTARVEGFWASLGARPAHTTAAAHDRLMASASHLPQLAANALAAVLADRGVAPADLGPGGLDATRLAASNPSMWRDILAHASPDLVAGLRGLSAAAREVADRVEAGDVEALEAYMDATRRWRRGP